MIVMRSCSKCKRELPATPEYFYSDDRPNQRKDRLHSWCKECINESNHAAHKRRMVEDPEGFRASKTNYRNSHPEQYLETGKRYREKLNKRDPHKTWKNTLRFKYNMSAEDYSQILREQGGKCCICGRTEPSPRTSQRYFCVDHNHKTSEIRGLLCYWCNTGLGLFQDSPNILHKAAEYIERQEEA